jgi:hypothetical protein
VAQETDRAWRGPRALIDMDQAELARSYRDHQSFDDRLFAVVDVDDLLFALALDPKDAKLLSERAWPATLSKCSGTVS